MDFFKLTHKSTHIKTWKRENKWGGYESRKGVEAADHGVGMVASSSLCEHDSYSLYS